MNDFIVGKSYCIGMPIVRKKTTRTRWVNLTFIAEYPHHYLFATDKGIKCSLSKVNFKIKQYRVKEE